MKRVDAGEKVGVICMNDGKPTVVEYSELGDLAKRLIDERREENKKEGYYRSLADGRLEYRAGNIANHLFTLDFLKRYGRNGRIR